MESVSVLLAVYKPNPNYFEKQLKSLDNQSYDNMLIYILDDSDDEKEHKKISEIVRSTLNKKEYLLNKNKDNFGSNKTFETLTLNAQGKYFAYCDQDDIWEENKIEILVKIMKEEDALIAYSDLSIIDDNDKLVASSFKDIRKRLVHVSGDRPYKFFLTRNSITGCTMLIDAELAKKSIPFQNNFVHDHWLALCGSVYGKISYTKLPLIRYRIHSNNQIGSNKLLGIKNKTDYLIKRIIFEENRLTQLRNRFQDEPEVLKTIDDLLERVKIRRSFFQKPKFKKALRYYKISSYDKKLFYFEVLLGGLNNQISNYLIKIMKNSKY